MVTAKNIINIIEEYNNTFKIKGHPVEIYVNPTMDDFKKLSPTTGLRFLANNDTKKVYVWDAVYSNHDGIAPRLGMNNLLSGRYLGGGTDEYRGNGLPICVVDDYVEIYIDKQYDPVNRYINFFKTIFSIDWSWVDKYFANTSAYMKGQKKIFIQKYGAKSL